jgi:hypothetical protein
MGKSNISPNSDFTQENSQTVQIKSLLSVDLLSRFKQHKLLNVYVVLIVWVAGACNYSITNPASTNSNPKPTRADITFAPVVNPEVSATPSANLSPTQSPENTPPVIYSACVDDMKILATFGNAQGDESGILIVWPGEEDFLSWRIQNNGTCVWDSAYSWQEVNTWQIATMTESATGVLDDLVLPGESVTVQFGISVPTSPGDYPVSWVLINGYRKSVGSPLHATIRVPGDALNRPLATMTRSPNVQFEASSTQVAPYERVALSWEVRQANKVYFYLTGQAWVSNQVPLKGMRIYYPTNDTAYNLRVVNADNTVESYKIEVVVEPPLGLPAIVQFDLLPQGHLTVGGCVDISWRVRGGLATSVNLFVNGILLLSNVDRIGEYSDCPMQAKLITYTLVASGPAGTVSKSKSINVEP